MGRGLDIRFIREEIPMREVLAYMNLETNGRRYTCWRPVLHKPRMTVSIFQKTNGVRCFECHPKVISTLDAVIDALGLDISGALRWFGERFQVPRVDPVGGKPRGAIGMDSNRSVEAFVLSPVFAELSMPARCLATVLVALAVRDPDGVVALLKRQLMERTGIGNRATLQRATSEIEACGLFSVGLMPTGRFAPRGWGVNSLIFRLTWKGAFEWGERSLVYARSKVNVEERSEVNGKRSEVGSHTKSHLGPGDMQSCRTEPGLASRPVENSDVGEQLRKFLAGHEIGGRSLTPGQEMARLDELRRQGQEIMRREAAGEFRPKGVLVQ